MNPSGEQKALLEYTKYYYSGRIPALIDHHNGDFVIWKSAILLYLTGNDDTEERVRYRRQGEAYVHPMTAALPHMC
ncbi:hypothetical protein BD310DRAFT_920914 [Dichomitus squalens]|uniref:GST N-terminal domain-containing protein n=1 Tax=Dichomitus squalens TaxID=114155 RepID=A0A4Q9Q3P6_9APHY|nr:hypothetical protein BD310DRAFT_920914 [Dichomitus squalens]